MVTDLVIAAVVAVVGGGTVALIPYVRTRRRSLPPGTAGQGSGVGTLEREEEPAAGPATLPSAEP